MHLQERKGHYCHKLKNLKDRLGHPYTLSLGLPVKHILLLSNILLTFTTLKILVPLNRKYHFNGQ